MNRAERTGRQRSLSIYLAYTSRVYHRVRRGIVSLRRERIIKSRPFVSQPPSLPPPPQPHRRAYVSLIAPAESFALGATGIKFFALKRYLPGGGGGGGGRYLCSADYKGINSEQLDFSDRAAPHSRGRSSRAHPEIRLPHEGATQAEGRTACCGFYHGTLFDNILRNCVSRRSIVYK